MRTPKPIKEPETITVIWSEAAKWLIKGYRIESLNKKGNTVYASLKKE